jgi:hypothetical protein
VRASTSRATTPDGAGVVVSGNLTHAVDPSGRDNVYDAGTFAYDSR